MYEGKNVMVEGSDVLKREVFTAVGVTSVMGKITLRKKKKEKKRDRAGHLDTSQFKLTEKIYGFFPLSFGISPR